MQLERRTLPVVPGRSCCHCGKLLDDQTAFVDFDSETTEIRPLSEPKAGDFSVCWYCCKPLAFTEDGDFRKLTPDEWAELKQNETFLTSVMAIRHLNGDEEIINGFTRVKGLMT